MTTLNEQIAADLATFVDADAGFAVDVTIAGTDIEAIFSEEYIEVYGVAGTHPLLYCVSSEVSAVAQGDEVTIGDDSYRVADIEPDGTGITMLVLEKIS